MSNTALGAVAFIAQVSQLLWAVPLALWADRGSRKLVAGVALLVFAGFGSLMALSPNVWWFAFLYLAASVGTGVNNTVHNSYLPTPTRLKDGAHLQVAQPVGPPVADDRDPDPRLRGHASSHDWRYGWPGGRAGFPTLGPAFFSQELSQPAEV